MAARRVVTVSLEAQTTGIMAGFATTIAAAKGLGKELETLSVKHTQSFKKLTDAGLGLGLGLVGAFALAEKATFGFDKQMSAVAAVADASAKQLGQLREAAIQAGRDTAYTATEAAQAEEELAKAGISTADILGGALKGSLELAAAGGISLGDSAKYAAQAMIEFGLAGKDVGHIADVLTAGANKSVTDVEGLGRALGQAGTVAHQAGMSLDETVGVLALFSQHGLDGVEAGTTFKQMLLKLEGPSGKSADLMKSLGIEVYDANGNFKSAAQLADTLQKSLGGLTEQQRNYALTTIFGSRAVRGAIDLYQAGAAGVNDWTNKVNDAGIAEKTAATKLDNLAGDVKKLEGSLQALAITSSTGATSGLRFLAQGAERAVNSFSVMPASVTKWSTAIVGAVGITLVGASVLGKLKVKSDEVQTSLTKMGPIGEKVGIGLGRITGAVGKLAIGLTALQVASTAFGSTIDPSAAKTAKDLEQLGATGKATGAELKHLSYDIGTVGSGGWTKFGNGVAGTVESLTGLGNVFDESMVHAQQRIAAIDAGLAQLVSSGNIPAATAAFAQLQAEAQRQGISVTDLNNALPAYNAALDNLTSANTGAAVATTDTADATDTLATSIEGAIGKVNGLKDALDALNGGNKSWIKAESDLYASFDAATKAIKENGKTAIAHGRILDITTDKGRANMKTLLDIADAAEAAAQSSLDQTHSQKAANDVLQQGREELYKDARAMGLSKDAAWELVNQLLKIPPVNAPVTLPGLTRAITQVGQLRQEIDKLHGKVISVTITHGNVLAGGSQASVNRFGGLYEHAAVGVLRQADVYRPVARGARYAFAEPQTKGEAFIPKAGNYGRSMSILSAAAGWYGASVVPGGRGGMDVNVHFTADPTAAAAARDAGIRATVSRHNGSVQKAYGF